MREKILIFVMTAVVGIPAAWLGRIPVETWLSARMRHQNNIPEIMGTKWRAEWQYDDGSPPLKDDIVTFSKWTKDNLFAGYGEITINNNQYRYSITGEVSPERVIL